MVLKQALDMTTQNRTQNYIYYSKVNYCENYYLMTRVLQNFNANLKILSRNGFGKS